MFSMLNAFSLIVALLCSGIQAQRQIEVHTIHLYQDQCTMTCLSGWTAYNFTYLQFIKEEKNWIEAEVYCQSLVPGGNLASIHSEENNDFVLDLVQKESSSYQKVWIGSSDKYKDDTQFWTDGSRWDYHNWFTGKPIAGSQGNTMNLVQVEKSTTPQDIAQQDEKAIQLLKPVNIELVHDGVSSRGHPLLVLK